MKTLLLQIGKTTDPHVQALISHYAGRIAHYLPFDVQTLPELRHTQALTPEQQKAQEGEQLLRALQPGDHVVLLDEHGKELRSIELARWMDRKMQTVPRRLVFIIGGPYGFSPQVYQAAHEQLSLSRLTFSHQLVRLFFTEQLYRAMTILRGEPYHHE